MQNLERYLADLKSTGKNTIETVEKSLTDMFIRLVRIYPCLVVILKAHLNSQRSCVTNMKRIKPTRRVLVREKFVKKRKCGDETDGRPNTLKSLLGPCNFNRGQQYFNLYDNIGLLEKNRMLIFSPYICFLPNHNSTTQPE